MTCGRIETGGCANPWPGHDGPCTPYPDEKTSRKFKALPQSEQKRLLAEVGTYVEVVFP